MNSSPTHPPGAPPGRARWPFLDALLGTGVLAVGEFAARGLAFVAVAVLTRRLGPEGFGVVGFATAIAGYLAIAVNNGVGEIGARDLATRDEDTAAVYGRVFAIRMSLAAVAWAVMLAVAALLPQPLDTRLVVAGTGLSFVSAAVDPGWAYKALGRPVGAVLVLLGGQALYAMAAILFVPGREAVVRVPLVQFGAELVAAVAGLTLLLGGRLPPLDWAGGRALLSRARYLTASRIVRGLTINFDMVLLGLTAATAQLGMYAAAYRVLFLLMAVGMAVSHAFLPVLSRATARPGPEARRALSAAVATATAIATPLALGGALLAPEFTRLLFGPAYLPGSDAFRLLMLAGGCFILHSAVLYAFVGSERTRTLSVIHLAAAILNVGLNLWGIPRYGIIAAAAATLAAEGLTAVAMLAILARALGVATRLPLSALLAGLPMAAVVVALAAVPLPLRVAAAAAAYAGTLLVFGGRELRQVLAQVSSSTR